MSIAKISLANLHLAQPWFLLLLCLIPVIVFWQRKKMQSVTLRYSDVRLVQGSTHSWRLRLRELPNNLRYLSLILLIIAVARPQAGRSSEIIRGKGVDIVLALDISGSMAAHAGAIAAIWAVRAITAGRSIGAWWDARATTATRPWPG